MANNYVMSNNYSYQSNQNMQDPLYSLDKDRMKIDGANINQSRLSSKMNRPSFPEVNYYRSRFNNLDSRSRSRSDSQSKTFGSNSQVVDSNGEKFSNQRRVKKSSAASKMQALAQDD